MLCGPVGRGSTTPSGYPAGAVRVRRRAGKTRARLSRLPGQALRDRPERRYEEPETPQFKVVGKLNCQPQGAVADATSAPSTVPVVLPRLTPVPEALRWRAG